MATMASERSLGVSKVGIARLALTGGLSAAAFAILCWVGARLGLGPVTHMYLQQFTSGEVSSGISLVVATCWSFVAGLIAGTLIALIYNLLAPLDGR